MISNGGRCRADVEPKWLRWALTVCYRHNNDIIYSKIDHMIYIIVL